MVDYAQLRQNMVRLQLKGRGLHDPRVLAAMAKVAREAFLSAESGPHAYDDRPLAINGGQTISQPYIVGLMIQAANLHPGDSVLEIGTGSGYAAAVLAEIATSVHTIERMPMLADGARQILKALGYSNIDVHLGDGTLGLPQAAPFDVILAAAAGPTVPQALREQLTIGGRLVMPVGESPGFQRLLKLTRTSATRFEQEDLGGVAFVPLIGEQGWNHDTAPARRQRHAAAAKAFKEIKENKEKK